MGKRFWLLVVIAACAGGFFASGVAFLGLTVDTNTLTAPEVSLVASVVAFAAVIGLVSLAMVAMRRRRSRRRRELALQGLLTCVKRMTADNIRNLRGVRRMLANEHFAGEFHRPKWFAFLEAFVVEKIEPALTNDELAECGADRAEIIHLIDSLVLAEAESASTGFSPTMTAAEFEHCCADTLQSVGWNARVNAIDRVQGVDIIATKRGRRVTLHCALDPRVVGVSTLETAEIGRTVEDGDFAVVVTGAPVSTVELSEATKRVVLVEYLSLANLDEILDGGQSGSAIVLTAILPPSAAAPFPPDEGKTKEVGTASVLRDARESGLGPVLLGKLTHTARVLWSATRRAFRRAPKHTYASAERAPWRDRQSPSFAEPIDDFKPSLDPPAVVMRPNDEPMSLQTRPSPK